MPNRRSHTKAGIVVRISSGWRLYSAVGYCLAERDSQLDCITLANKLGLRLVSNTQLEGLQILSRLPKASRNEIINPN